METTKLTLEHLSVYFPYGLKVKCKMHKIFKSDRILEVDGIQSIDGINLISLTESIKRYDVMLFKPVLKPLSYFEDIQEHPELDWYDIVSLRRLSRGNVKLNDVPYYMIAIMAKEHFDFFNLIPAGLAINYF